MRQVRYLQRSYQDVRSTKLKKKNLLLQYRGIIVLGSEVYIKHKNILCGQNVEFFSVKPSDIHSVHCALNG